MSPDNSMYVLIQVDATVRELAERSLSLQLCITSIKSARYPIFQRPFVAHPQGFSPRAVAALAKERYGS